MVSSPQKILSLETFWQAKCRGFMIIGAAVSRFILWVSSEIISSSVVLYFDAGRVLYFDYVCVGDIH